MRSWLRRIRGAIGVGLTWAAGWGLFGGTLWLFRAWEIALSAGFNYAVSGFVGGALFSLLLRLAEGRRRFDELKITRFAGWGALGGLLIGVGYAVVATTLYPEGDYLWGQYFAITTVLGAGSAAGSLALARVTDDRQLLEQGEEAADVGLSSQEQRELLGAQD